MAKRAGPNQEHLDLLKQGVKIWNQWRQEHPHIRPVLREAILRGVNARDANLSKVILIRADLRGADLRGANLNKASLYGANFSGAQLSGANLQEARFIGADLSGADLSGADLHNANLSWANLSDADLSKANLTGSRIYAISAWNVKLAETIQAGLIVTPESESESIVTVDDLEVAQFIYLLLNNNKLRKVIDIITSKVILILGRFTPDRKAALDTIRSELCKHNYTPVLFDFEKPASRDLTETVSILAHLARFIIVDLTDPSSAPYEVATIIPQTVVPVQPLLLREPLMVDGKALERREFAMFEDLRRRYHWVLPTVHYQDIAELLVMLEEQIIEPAEQKARELAQ